MTHPNIRRVLVALVLACVLAGTGFVGAFLIRDSEQFPFTLANRIGGKIQRVVHAAFAPDPPADPRTTEDERFASIFTPITAQVVNVPLPERDGYGGAATSWGEHVAVLTHEGTIHIVDADLSITLASVDPPENNFSRYLEVAQQPPWDEAEHNFGYFRYNDILFAEVDGRPGFLISYTKFHPEKSCFFTALARLTLPGETASAATATAVPEDWVDIFETAPCLPLKSEWRALEGHMAGGRIAFDGEDTVYLASGEYHWDGIYGPRFRPGADPDNAPPIARDPDADYGKVIAIDIRTGEARHLSHGHRNMQGIAQDRSGNVWVVEHGIRGGDELNLIREGRDYGWPEVSYGTLYSQLPIPDTLAFGRHPTFEKPRIAWLPSIATSGLTRVEGFHEAWDGDLLVATLRSEQLARIRLDGDRVVFTEFIDVGRRIRHVHQGANGRIVLWTNDYQLLFLSPARGGLEMRFIERRIERLTVDEATRRGVRSALHACIECHALNPNDDTTAPSLASVVGSPIGSTGYRGYSDAMKADRRVWTRELLIEFLEDPNRTVPGTAMPKPNFASDAVAREVVDLLGQLSTGVE